jgi:hypothetical protein
MVPVLYPQLRAEKHDPSLRGIAAVPITDQLEWVKAQFRAMRKGRKLGDLAFALLSRTQGAAMLARTLGDPSLLKRRRVEPEEWVERGALPGLN